MDKRKLLDLINEFQIEKNNENVSIYGNPKIIGEIEQFNFPNNITFVKSTWFVDSDKIYIVEGNKPSRQIRIKYEWEEDFNVQM